MKRGGGFRAYSVGVETNFVLTCYLMFTLIMTGGGRFLIWWYMALVSWARRMVRDAGNGSLWRDMRKLFRLDSQVVITGEPVYLPGGWVVTHGELLKRCVKPGGVNL